MQLTQHTDYALRVLIYLGGRIDRRVTISEVSTYFDISRSHLTKVVNQLVREGFVIGARGKGGGLQLARAASEIKVGEVIRCMERNLVLVECFAEQTACVLASGCKLKVALGKALEAFLSTLDAVTLEDLLAPAQGAVQRVELVAKP
jgi:Rrf2 family transcriptional regulator, nitric oxide-sensitive transcriptional repressor